MKYLMAATAVVGLLVPAAWAQDSTSLLTTHLYEGTAAAGAAEAGVLCAQGQPDGCFATGLLELVSSVETLSQQLYRYGATTPGTPAAAMLLGIGPATGNTPVNPHPEALSYEALRTVLDDFVIGLDAAGKHFEQGGQSGDYVIVLDPLRVRLDFNGDGKTEPGETLAALISPLADDPTFGEQPVGKTKGTLPVPDTTIGFDRADSLWFAGYTQVTTAPIDLVLAHDFSEFFAAYLHRVFPKSGLPMQDYSRGGMLFMDPESDTGIADIVAAIHTLDFPVIDSDRLKLVLTRLKAITTLSRQNWNAILAETDDNRELVPSPGQTSLAPDMVVTQGSVNAWMATLDTVDKILDGQLLVPHWRFKQGFDLKAYFETATETDLVMLLTGHDALPYLKAGPIADANSFAEANRVFGTDWINYAFWFN